MNVPSTFRAYRLVTTLELDVELGGEQERLRLELFLSDSESRAYRVRLWRTTFVESLFNVDEKNEQAQVTEWQTLEDFSEMLDPVDLEFEADSLADAESRTLQKLKARLGEAAWAKG